MGAGAFVLLVAIALVVVLAQTSSTYVLAAQGEDIVVLEGRLGVGDQPPTGDVVHTFDHVKLDDFAETTQDDLRAPGIDVESVSDAEDAVDNRLPRFVGPKDTPTPEPKGSPKATKEPTPKPNRTKTP